MDCQISQSERHVCSGALIKCSRFRVAIQFGEWLNANINVLTQVLKYYFFWVMNAIIWCTPLDGASWIITTHVTDTHYPHTASNTPLVPQCLSIFHLSVSWAQTRGRKRGERERWWLHWLNLAAAAPLLDSLNEPSERCCALLHKRSQRNRVY